MTAPGSGVLRLFDRLNQTAAIRFLDYVLEKLPFKVEVIHTLNGAEFGSQFHYHVLDRGIGHVYIRPRTPRLNGKVDDRTASTRRSSTGCSKGW